MVEHPTSLAGSTAASQPHETPAPVPTSTVDLSTLSWCIGEIRESLHQAEANLEQQLRAVPDDFTALRNARNQVHQAHGALLVVDVPGAGALTEEAEAVLAAAAAGGLELDETLVGHLRAAFDACVEYLDDLLRGQPDRPLYLFPYMQALLKARNAEREHPADLFFPDLTRRLPDSLALPQVSVGDFDAADAQDATDARKAFEKGLLKFLREPGKPRGVDYMMAAVGMVEHHDGNAVNRNTWRVILAFLEALRSGAIQPDVYTKRLLARINLQLRASVTEGGGPIADRLLKDALFALATATGGTPLADATRRVYGLAGVVPPDFMIPRYGRFDSRGVKAAREALSQARLAWDSVGRGNAADAGALVQALKTFQTVLKRFAGPGLQGLAQSLVDSAQAMAARPSLFEAPVALEAATAILFAEQVLEESAREPARFDDRATQLASRVKTALQDQDLGPVPGWLQELSSAAQDRLTMASFVTETLSSLRSAEKELDDYFRDPARTEGLADAARQLTQVAGALRLLGHDEAARGADATADWIQGFGQDGKAPDPVLSERVAANCGALGFYVECLQQTHVVSGQFEFDASLGEFRARMTESGRPQPMVQDDVSWLEPATPSAPLPATAAPASPTHEADVVAESGVQTPASFESQAPAVAAAELAPSPAPTAMAVEPPVIMPEGEPIDQELLEIFLAEAAEVLDAIAEAVGQSRRAPSDQQYLTTIRRGFHTLKGSSRMVGLNAFGEGAWALEQTMNLWLADNRPASTDLFSLIEAATSRMRTWVEGLEAGQSVAIHPAGLIASAEAFGRDGRFVEPVDAPVEAPTVAPAQAPAAASLPDTTAEAPAAPVVETPAAPMAEAQDAPATAAPDTPATAAAAAFPLLPAIDAVDASADPVAAALGAAVEQVSASLEPTATVDVPGPATATLEDVAASALEATPLDLPELPVLLAEAGIADEAMPVGAVPVEGDDTVSLGEGIAWIEEADSGADAPETIELDVLSPIDEPDLEVGLPGFNDQMDAAIASLLAEHPHVGHESTLADQAEDHAHLGLDAFAREAEVEADRVAVPVLSETIDPAAITSAAPTDLVPPDAGLHEDDAVEWIEGDVGIEVETDEVEALAVGDDPVDSDRHGEEVAPLATEVLAPLEAAPVESDPNSDSITIGDRSISRALYGIFLGEAVSLVNRLVQDCEDWRRQPDREASREAARAAHSLAGSAGLVGLEPVHRLAERFEALYVSQSESGQAFGPADFDVVAMAAERMRTMLGEFAAGVMPDEDADALDALSLLHLRLIANRPRSGVQRSVLSDEEQWEAAALEAEEAALAAEQSDPIEVDQVQVHGSAPAVPLPASPLEAALTADLGVVAEAGLPAEPIGMAEESAAPIVLDELDAELLPIFVEEADDLLPGVGTDLRRWADHPSDGTLARNLMRALHTIKGSARMAGAMNLGQRVHEMETRIEALTVLPTVPRAQIDELIADHDQVMSLFEAIKDPSKAIPAAVVSSGTVAAVAGAQPFAADVAALPAGAAAVAAVAPGESAAQTPRAPAEAGEAAVQQKAPVPLVRVRADLLDLVVNEAGEASIARSKLDNELTSMRQSLADLSENVNRLRTQLREIEIQAESQIQAHFAQTKELDRSFDPLEFDRYTRFQELTRMMAESVSDVATVQVNAAKNLDEATQELVRQGQVLRDLQQNLMRVRMVQFGTIADRLFRVARQSAKETGKRVNLDVRGATVEVDRGVLEKMAGPLEHLVRNAVAHGIEGRDARQAAGKAETGEIRVEVRQEGNEIILVMADDGSGLDLTRIRARAEANGLLTAEAQPSDRELRDLIFAPGFSTADRVTELSGRGVGMDVVRVETSALGGRIETDSTPGQGTRFTIHLPLTLAVAQVVLMGAAGMRFAVSSSSVEQVLQLKPEALATGYTAGHIEWQGGKVPLFYLGALVELQDRSPVAQHYSPVAILRSGNQRIALHVDTLARNQEVVVKNVGRQVMRVPGVSGATVLGNGDIVLIINPVHLAIEAVGPGLDALAASAPMIQRIALEMPPVVMVVDDSVTVRKVTQRLLVRESYQVVLAKDGVDALRQMEDTVPDVMLVDIEMPRMDGFDLTRAVRADARFAHIPIIMITSRTADRHRNVAMELGVNAYLGKPYSEETLLRQIEGFLQQRNKQKVRTH